MDDWGPWLGIFRCQCGVIVWARQRPAHGIEHGAWQIRHGDGEAVITWTTPEVAAAWDKTPGLRSSWLWPKPLSDWIATVHAYEGDGYTRADFIVRPRLGGAGPP